MEVLAPIRDKVISHIHKHEFHAAATLLASLFVLPANKKFLDFLAGKTVVHNHYANNSQQLQDFYSSVVNMMTKKEDESDVRYESALAAISNSKFQAAEQVIGIKIRRTKKKEKAQHSKTIDTAVYQGILGIIKYFQWQEEREKGRGIEETQEQELYNKACAHFSKAKQLDYHCQGFVYYYCKLLLEHQEVDEIIEELKEFRRRNPDNPLAHRMLGTILLHHNSHDASSDNYELMVECFKEELKLDPVSEIALQVLVNVFFTQGGVLVSEKEIMFVVCQYVDYLPSEESTRSLEALPWEILWTVLQRVLPSCAKEFIDANPRWFHHHFSPTLNSYIGPFQLKCRNYFLLNKMVSDVE